MDIYKFISASTEKDDKVNPSTVIRKLPYAEILSRLNLYILERQGEVTYKWMKSDIQMDEKFIKVYLQRNCIIVIYW